MKGKLSRYFSIIILALLLLSAVPMVFRGQVASAQAFSVTVLSPTSGSVFNRGQVVTVTASVSMAGTPVSGASVTGNNPTGGTFILSETSTPGTYSAHYTVLSTDPLGTWTINVQALKNGQVASGQTSVTISGALKVSVLVPVASAKFNIGETATVKASVTFQDNSPVSASASVSFSEPVAGSVPMTQDASDPTGKTWTGSYTIVGSDVPADGFTWPITVTASLGGDVGSAIQSVNLFRTLKVDVATFSSSTYATPKDNFAKGETVFVSALVGLQDALAVSSGTVVFEISGTSIAAAPVAMTFSSSNNRWTGSYTLLASDQTGPQTVTLSAADPRGNAGSGTHQINVLPAQAFSVSISSPSPNLVFNRGQVVTISAVVTLSGSPVTGATVTANTPTGATLTLANVGGGTYTVAYTVASTDPAGSWTITVQASQGTQTGSAQVAEAVSSSLQVTVVGPAAGSKFNIGQVATVRAMVTYQNGLGIPGSASVTFNRPVSGTVLMFLDPSDATGKTWMASYMILSSDVSFDGFTWAISVAAGIGGNSGTSSPTNVNLFTSLRVAVSTWSSSAFTFPKDSFVRGETVFVKAQVTHQDGSVVPAGTVSFRITGTSVANSPIFMTFSGLLNAWTGSYTLLQADQTGGQVVSVSALDGVGNTGSGTHTIGIEVPVPAGQPLEARITFNLQTQDIAVIAVCNSGCLSPTTVTVTSTSQNEGGDGGHHHGDDDDEGEGGNGGGVLRTYVISDSAGHTLTLQVSVKAHGHEVKAQLRSIQYGNSAPITPPDNKVAFESSQSEGGSAKSLQQSISVHGVGTTTAHFNAHKNTTTIQIDGESEDDDDEGGRSSSMTMTGLWLLELNTSNGSLGVSFFQAG